MQRRRQCERSARPPLGSLSHSVSTAHKKGRAGTALLYTFGVDVDDAAADDASGEGSIKHRIIAQSSAPSPLTMMHSGRWSGCMYRRSRLSLLSSLWVCIACQASVGTVASSVLCGDTGGDLRSSYPSTPHVADAPWCPLLCCDPCHSPVFHIHAAFDRSCCIGRSQCIDSDSINSGSIRPEGRRTGGSSQAGSTGVDHRPWTPSPSN